MSGLRATSMRTTWLELLPPEICINICRSLAPRMWSRYLLKLANTVPCLVDPLLRSSMFTFMLYEDIDWLQNTEAAEWAPIVSTKLTRVHVDGDIDDQVLSLFATMPSLHYACFWKPTEHVLSWIEKHPNVRQLEFALYSDVTFNRLLQAMSVISLEILSIRCFCSDSLFDNNDVEHDLCGFADLGSYNDRLKALFSSCPFLRELVVPACICNGLKPSTEPKSVICLPKRLEKFQIDGNIPAGIRDHLPLITNINISPKDNSEQPHFVENALQFGSMLSALRTNAILSTESLAALHWCPNLTELDCHIESGTETMLSKALLTMPRLDKLSLHWKSDHSRNTYLRPIPGIMYEVAKAAKRLTRLELKDVLLSRGERSMILKEIGLRLRGLSLFHCREADGETCAEQVAAVVESIIKYNNNLQLLNLNCGRSGCRDTSRGDEEALFIPAYAQIIDRFFPSLCKTGCVRALLAWKRPLVPRARCGGSKESTAYHGRTPNNQESPRREKRKRKRKRKRKGQSDLPHPSTTPWSSKAAD